MEDRGKKRGEEESEGGSDSEESYKSEEIPSEDACSHCGLPNHPELVSVWLCESFTILLYTYKYLDTPVHIYLDTFGLGLVFMIWMRPCGLNEGKSYNNISYI